MKRWFCFISAAAVLSPGICHSADAVAPLRAASGPVLSGSPAVQAAENARPEPGGVVQPEAKAVPQVNIPLQRSATAGGAPMAIGPSGQGGIDDDAARCSAKKTKKERADCRSSVAAPTKAPDSIKR